MKKVVTIPEGSEDEQAMFRAIAKKFGLKIKEDTTVRAIPGKVKVIKIVRYCGLCESTTFEFVKMLKYTDGTWRSAGAIAKEEAKKINNTLVQKDNVTCCVNCTEFLMSKSKEELVKMITRANSPMLVNLVSKRALEEMRKEKEEKSE